MPSFSPTFHLAGTGVALPRTRIASTHLDQLVGTAPGWVESRFGIAERRWAQADETSSSLGAQAAQAALADAGWAAPELDVIVGACGVMEQPIPGTAVLIQRRLGLGMSGITAFDVNATCLSFLLALDTVLNGFAASRWRKALIVGADLASAALDFSDPEASVIFGDGAAAVALSADGPHRLRALQLSTYGVGTEYCRLEAGGTRLRPQDDLADFLARSKFRMDGPGLFKFTARRFPAFLRGLLQAAQCPAGDLHTVIPHQASAPALEYLKRSLPDGPAKTIDIFRHHGNQIAVSLPHALHAARQAGRLEPGSNSLLVGTSAGVSLGGAVIQW
jgi:3-oxoacyl-[acyl-carrier-protein] synthase-3